MAVCANAFALDADRTLREFQHTRWTADDGAPTNVTSITQTSDGFLWLAGQNGLYRFDGIAFEPFEVATGQRLHARNVYVIKALRGGGLAIGYALGGISIYRGNVIRHYTEADGLPQHTVVRFAEEGDVLWATIRSGLMRLDGDRWRTVDASWGLPDKEQPIVYPLVDRSGTLWTWSPKGIWYRLRGERVFHAYVDAPRDIGWVAEAPGGQLWISSPDEIQPIRFGERDATPRALRPIRLSTDYKFYFDRNGGLWSTRNDQLLRVPSSGAPVERFGTVDGLSSGNINDLFEDREGNFWLATAAGLDRFRPRNLVRIDLPVQRFTFALVAASQGVVVTGDRLFEPDGTSLDLQEISPPVTCLYRDPDGQIWIGSEGGVFRLQGGHYERPLPALPGPIFSITAIVRDVTGTLWVSAAPTGVYRWNGSAWELHGGLEKLPREPVITLAADAHGRVWFGYTRGRIGLLDSGRERLFTSEDGVAVGDVNTLYARGERLWAGGGDGVALFDGRSRFVPLVTREVGAFAGTSGIVETAAGDVWLNGIRGVARIPRSEIEQFRANPRHVIDYEHFDARDGLQGTAIQFNPQPSLVEDAGGRLWFSTGGGIQWLDPARVYRNKIPPPVVIKGLRSAEHFFLPGHALTLPPRTSEVEIDYAGLSLGIPERVRYRYRLQGVDNTWREVGTRREAVYTNLGPGDFVFQVLAANESGVWNLTGAQLQFSILPTFTQTWLFKALCAVMTAGLLWALYRVRMRQVSGRIHARLEERLNERERIAREIHDTLLQGIYALTARLHAAIQRMPRSDSARAAIEQALDRADVVLAEGRDRVTGLRASTEAPSTLAAEIGAIARQFEETQGHPVVFEVRVEGDERTLHLAVREEIVQIAREALANTYRHAQARSVVVELIYGRGVLRMKVRDDGEGFDTSALAEAPGANHWGVVGMRERARKLRGHLDIWSRRGEGTEITLSIPGRVAYGRRQLR